MAKVKMIPVKEAIDLREQCLWRLIHDNSKLLWDYRTEKYNWNQRGINTILHNQYPKITSTLMRHFQLLTEEVTKLADVDFDSRDDKQRTAKAKLLILGMDAIDRFLIEGLKVTDPLKLRNLRLSITKSWNTTGSKAGRPKQMKGLEGVGKQLRYRWELIDDQQS